MRLRNRLLTSSASPETNINTSAAATPDSLSPPVFDKDEGDDDSSDCSDIAAKQERSNCTYLGDAYYTVPCIFDDAEHMSDPVLFRGDPWLD